MIIFLILECIAVCFFLLLACTVAIANGPVQAVFLYERDVQERVAELGLISRERIWRNNGWIKAVGLTAMFGFILWAVYGINGARGFVTPFHQIYAMLMSEGLFDRFFIDWYWVGHTKAWTIPGTEDLKPYIPKKTWGIKWGIVLIGNPLIAAVLAGIMQLFFK